MNREQFDALVQRVERTYAQRPVRLRLRIAAYLALSYALFLGWVLLALVPGGALILAGSAERGTDVWWLFGFGVALMLGLGGWALSVFRVKLEPPEGVEVKRGTAPALFDLLDELRHVLKSAKFHTVLVDGRCNAAVVQTARLGVFGWQRNYLLLGLPLLDSLSREELRAVLAHEFTHLSAQHGRFGAWIYRLRASWEKVFDALAKQERGRLSLRPILGKFIDWFWPRFHAHAFVLSRANEYVADRGSAQTTGVEHIASALLRSEYYGRLLEEKAWPDVWLEANRLQEPVPEVFDRIVERVRGGAAPEESRRWVEQAFRRTTTNADTHPCLTERLRALGFLPADLERGVFPPAPLAPAPSATEAVFGPAALGLRRELGRRWQKLVLPRWKEVHARAGALQHRLASIDRAVAAPESDVDSLWDKARMTIDLENDAAAEPMLRQILTLHSRHAPANFCLGRHLLTGGNEEGVLFLQTAMDVDEDLVVQGCEMLIEHHRRHGREAAIRELMLRLDAHEAALKSAREECSNVSARDTFIPHGLEAAQVEAAAAIFRQVPEIRSVRVARKQLHAIRKQRLFVVSVKMGFRWFGGGENDHALIARLTRELKLPGRTLIIAPGGIWAAVSRKVCRVPGAEIYRR